MCSTLSLGPSPLAEGPAQNSYAQHQSATTRHALRCRSHTPDEYDLHKDWSASMAVDMDCCATPDIVFMFAVGGHVLALCGTSLSDLNDATRSRASARCCGVTVTCLCALGTLLVKSEAIVMSTPLQPESTVSQFTSCCSLKGTQMGR